ncbi:MAG: hypothetical protein Q8O89_00975, partial [Nanoarchaeota archaeon]|nr:hypothetical protein [Nanoarchaeota archaeon]
FDLKKMSKQSFSDFYEAHVKYNGIGFMGINRFTFKDKTEVDVFYELDTKKLEYSDTSFIEGFARAGGSEFTEKDLAEINQFKRIKSRDYRKLVQERKTFFPEWTPVSSLEELTKLILDYPFVFTRYFKSTQKVDEKSAELIAQALFNSHIYKNSLGNVIIKFDESYKPIGLRDYKLDRGIVMFLEAASLGEANKEYGGFDKEGLSLYLGGKHDYEYYLIKNLKHRIDIGVNNISYDSETNSYFVNIDMDYPNFQFHLTAFLKHEGNLISAFVNQPVIDEKVRYRDEDDVLRLSVTNVVERNLESVAQEIKYAAESYGLLPITVFSFLDYICPSLDDCYEPFFFKPLSEDLSPFGALDNNQLYIVNLCDFPHVKKLKDRSTKEFEDYVLPKPRNAIDTQSLPECQN